MRRAKRCKDKVNPAQLAACKILANTQASEDVVCSAHTSFGGAARALGARRAASIMEAVPIAAKCPTHTRPASGR